MDSAIQTKIKKHLKGSSIMLFLIYLGMTVYGSFADANIKVVDFSMKEIHRGPLFIEYYVRRIGSEDEGSYTNFFLMKNGSSKTFLFRVYVGFFPDYNFSWFILFVLMALSPFLLFSLGAWLLYPIHKKLFLLDVSLVFLDMSFLILAFFFLPLIGFVQPFQLTYCCV